MKSALSSVPDMSTKAWTLGAFVVVFVTWRAATRFMSDETDQIVLFSFTALLIAALIIGGFIKSSRDARSAGDRRGSGASDLKQLQHERDS